MTAIRLLALLIAALSIGFLVLACGDDDEEDDCCTPPPETPALTGEPTEALSPTEAPGDTDEPSGAMSLTSSAFDDDGAMPVQYTCDDPASVSPPLTIGGVPEDAASLALLTVDIDGPGGNFVHWTVWDIDPTTTSVAEDEVPGGGGEGQTSLGDGGYFGPCPPSGTHRYVFTLHALDTELDLDPASDGQEEIEAAIEGHVLDTAELTGTYSRE